MAVASPVHPVRPTRRTLSAALAGLAAVPLALLVAGAGQAAPTLTLPEAEAQLSALQTQEDVAVEAFNAGQIAATAAGSAATQARAAVATQAVALRRMQAGIASFAVATYEGANLDPTDAMLSGGTPSDAVQRADALSAIAGLHARQLAAITAQQQVLANARLASDQRAAAAAAAVTALQTTKAHVDALITQQQQVVSGLQAEARAQLLAQQAAERAAAEQAAAAAAAAARASAAAAAAAQQAAAAARQPAARASAPASAPVNPSPGGGSTAPAPAPGHAPAGSNAGAAALQYAESKQGDPYVYGAAGPSTFDCSGLVLWAFAQVGVSLPHSAAAQMGYGTPVAQSDLQPGDIVFYDEGGTIGHDGIYVGNGEMIDANHTGGWVGIRPLYSGYAGARRL